MPPGLHYPRLLSSLSLHLAPFTAVSLLLSVSSSYSHFVCDSPSTCLFLSLSIYTSVSLIPFYTSLSQLNTESHSHFLSLLIPLLLPHHLLAFSLAQQFISPHYLNYQASCLVCIKYSITNSGTISYT